MLVRHLNFNILFSGSLDPAESPVHHSNFRTDLGNFSHPSTRSRFAATIFSNVLLFVNSPHLPHIGCFTVLAIAFPILPGQQALQEVILRRDDERRRQPGFIQLIEHKTVWYARLRPSIVAVDFFLPTWGPLGAMHYNSKPFRVCKIGLLMIVKENEK